MLFGEPPGPRAAGQVTQGFGLAEALERVAEHGLDQVEQAQRDLAIGLDPPAQVVEELFLEHGLRSLSHP